MRQLCQIKDGGKLTGTKVQFKISKAIPSGKIKKIPHTYIQVLFKNS